MINVRKLVMSNPDIVYAKIQQGSNTVSTANAETTKTTYITVQALLVNDDINNGTIARDIGKIIVKNHSTAITKDIIQVTLTYGYDIGIWSFWSNLNHKFTPNDFN